MTNELSDAFLDRFEDVNDLEIENFVVDFDEIVEKIVDEIVKFLSFSLLKFRFETISTISFFIDFV